MLVKHGHAPTDEAAWREQVDEAMKAVREKHKRAEREARDALQSLQERREGDGADT